MSSIGDIVLTSPVLRALKTQLQPAPEIHFLVRKPFYDTIAYSPHVDKIHTMVKEVGEVIEDLKAEQFDHVVDLHKNYRSIKLRRQLKKVPSTSFKKHNMKKWVFTNFKINKMPDVHIVERYFEAVRELGVKNDDLGLEYYNEFHEGDYQSSLKEEEKEGYVVVVPGAAHFTKTIPTDKLIAICKGINKPVYLIGGEADSEKAAEICAGAGDHVHNMCGANTLSGSAEVIRKCDKILTPDTGMMHIAAAYQKEIVSVWGNTVPAFGMYPYLPQAPDRYTILEVDGLSCRPCSKIGHARCPRGHFKCMREIDVQQVIDLMNA